MPAQTAVHFSLDMTVNACSSDISLHMHAWRRWVSIGWYLVDAGSTASDIVGAMINEDEPSRRSGGGSARRRRKQRAGADLPLGRYQPISPTTPLQAGPQPAGMFCGCMLGT